MLIIISIIIVVITIISLCMIGIMNEFSKKAEFTEEIKKEEKEKEEETEEEKEEETEEEITVSSLIYLIAKEEIEKEFFNRKPSFEKNIVSSNRGNNKIYNKKHTSYTKYDVCPKRGYHDPRYKDYNRKTIRTIQDPEWF